MINIGDTIILLRKQKEWSQTELANKVGVSREIISKYEKGNVTPSVEVAKKIADAFEVSLDYLVGEGQNSSFDKKTVKRLQAIENLDGDTKEKVYFFIDMAIRDAQTKRAFNEFGN